MIVDGKARFILGVSSLARMPLNYLYPAGQGRLVSFLCVLRRNSRVGCICRTRPDGVAIVCALSTRWQNWVGGACLVGFVFGSPLLFFVGSPTIYNEAILWGFAWSVAGLYFALRSREADGAALTWSLLAFSCCAARLYFPRRRSARLSS
jgi:hypothetical protein